MVSFLGTYAHTIDPKGRLSIPAKLRKTVELFVLTRGLDGCLFLYSTEEWGVLERQLRLLKFTSKRARFFLRQMSSHAREVSIDGHGRIMVAPELRELAGLGRDVLVIGAMDRIEIWDPKKYESYRDDFGLSYEDVAETVWEDSQRARGETEHKSKG